MRMLLEPEDAVYLEKAILLEAFDVMSNLGEWTLSEFS
jgi:hypothetical protein